MNAFYAVIPAGGSGTRLWPISRQARPKFLLDIEGNGVTLLDATLHRTAALQPAKQLIVTGAAHADAVAQAVPDSVEVLVEPSARDSMAAIGLAAAVIAERDPDAIMGSFAADHRIGSTDGFVRSLQKAITVASEGFLVTVGIPAAHPSTAFGYIKAGETLASGEGRLVAEFVEKPDLHTAQGYLADGSYTWNAGMFVVRVSVLLALLAEHHPVLHAGLVHIAKAYSTDQFTQVRDAVWPTLTKISIDHALAEPVAARGGVAVVAAEFDWDDVGDYAALHSLIGGGSDVSVLGDKTQVIADGKGLVIGTTGRLIAVDGLENYVVVDTADALLVTTLDRSQQVKHVVEALRAAGHPEVL